MSNKNKNILLGVLIVGILSMTVAFAALSTRLNINGTTNVAATKWNIRFENWDDDTESTVTVGGQTHNNTASYTVASRLTKEDSTNVTKVSDVNVTLNQPGDYARYTFEIANRGTIDAKLDNFTVTDTSENTLVDHDVKCYEANSLTGTPITTNYVLGVEQRVYCYLQVQYKDKTNSHTAGTDQTYNQATAVNTSLSAAWTWVQNNGSSSSASEPVDPTAGFDTFYTPTQKSGGPLLPEGSTFWVQKNSSGDTEVCGVVGSSAVCLTNNENGHELNGEYALRKKAEFEAYGVSCSVGDRYMDCNSSDVLCYIGSGGDAGCRTSDRNGCSITYLGNVNCY